MVDSGLDVRNFFDRYPRFLETSETGPWASRLNARYLALIDANRDLIDGSRVVDLASHDGRWSFAALKNGAVRVVGIEHKPRLVRKTRENMELYGVDPNTYDFVTGDMFERLDDTEPCDVVFCFGIFYHINHHMLLLSKIAALQPRAVIFDTAISLIAEPVIELVHEAMGHGVVVGQPSRAALDEMFTVFGWTAEYFDWKASGLTDEPYLDDYGAGKRVSVVARCSLQDATN